MLLKSLKPPAELSTAGVWVPTQIEQWQNCPCPLEERLKKYRYVIEENGDWVDEYAPDHYGHVLPTATFGTFEGRGNGPGEYKAVFTLQSDGILKLAFGSPGDSSTWNGIYYVVREGDSRASASK
jgi:hypothetical protein